MVPNRTSSDVVQHGAGRPETFPRLRGAPSRRSSAAQGACGARWVWGCGDLGRRVARVPRAPLARGHAERAAARTAERSLCSFTVPVARGPSALPPPPAHRSARAALSISLQGAKVKCERAEPGRAPGVQPGCWRQPQPRPRARPQDGGRGGTAGGPGAEAGQGCTGDQGAARKTAPGRAAAAGERTSPPLFAAASSGLWDAGATEAGGVRGAGGARGARRARGQRGEQDAAAQPSGRRRLLHRLLQPGRSVLLPGRCLRVSLCVLFRPLSAG